MQAYKGVCGGIAVLIVVTALMLGWQYFGMNRVFRIDAAHPYNATAIDDRNSGGKSWTSVSLDHGALDWDCHVRNGFAWPFCELAFEVGALPQGHDFSRDDTFVIRLQRQGGGSRRLRLFMRNFEAAHSNPQDPVSWRQNELQFDAPDDMRELQIPLRYLNVAAWWLAERKIHMGQALVNVSSVPSVLLSTAGLPEEADQHFRIEYIEFRGKYLSQAEVAFGLLGMWVCAALAFALRLVLHRPTRPA